MTVTSTAADGAGVDLGSIVDVDPVHVHDPVHIKDMTESITDHTEVNIQDQGHAHIHDHDVTEDHIQDLAVQVHTDDDLAHITAQVPTLTEIITEGLHVIYIKHVITQKMFIQSKMKLKRKKKRNLYKRIHLKMMEAF